MIRTLMITFVCFVVAWSSAAVAGGLSKPVGPVVLTVSGKINVTNQGDLALFDHDMLMKVQNQTVVTDTPWHPGVHEFQGPDGKALMEMLGVSSGYVQITALNDYTARVPVADFLDKGLILAVKVDGKTMTVRDKGPIFMIYPFKEHPELRNERIYARSVWQVKAIKVE